MPSLELLWAERWDEVVVAGFGKCLSDRADTLMTTMAAKAARMDRRLQGPGNNSYKPVGKYPEPTVCPVCSAVFKGGRWQWAEAWPVDSHRQVCEACRRVQDDAPAGILTLTGAYVQAHVADILGLVRNLETAAKSEHPLERVLRIVEEPGRLVITTTDLHLPRRIADALVHAHKGELEKHYDEDGCLLRVTWRRDL